MSGNQKVLVVNYVNTFSALEFFPGCYYVEFWCWRQGLKDQHNCVACQEPTGNCLRLCLTTTFQVVFSVLTT